MCEFTHEQNCMFNLKVELNAIFDSFRYVICDNCILQD